MRPHHKFEIGYKGKTYNKTHNHTYISLSSKVYHIASSSGNPRKEPKDLLIRNYLMIFLPKLCTKSCLDPHKFAFINGKIMVLEQIVIK